MGKATFTRKEHLRKNALIQDVFDKGLSFKCRLSTIFLLKNDRALCNRAAFTVRKNLYNKKLVLRNRFRRILKEAYRQTKHLLPDGYDIVILATGLTEHTKSTEIEKEFTNVFKKRTKG